MEMRKRPRRLRNNFAIRSLVRENTLTVDDFVYPLFVVEGENIKREISTLKNLYHYSVDQLEAEIKEIYALGIKSIILFGVPDTKDACATSAFDANGIVQRAIHEVKRVCPEMYVITDVCMCQYTDHGHCGILDEKGVVINDETLVYLSKIALSHVAAGADMVSPSDMMDGRIAHMRETLDAHDRKHIPIMAYSAKYASSFYGPFRAAANSAPGQGDRKAYQMDFHNGKEALREVALDIEEGADIVMVKPALSYLDVVKEISLNFDMPIAAYNVSGEYAMIMNAIDAGLMSEDVIYEKLVSMKRAGADIIITYFAKYMAKKLKEQN